MTPLAHAQPAEDPAEAANAKLREALRGVTTQLRTAQTDLATAQSAQAESERQNKELKTKLESVTQKAGADKDLAQQAIDELKVALDKEKTQNEQYRQALAKWKQAYENAANIAGTKENARASLAGQVDKLQLEVEARERNNLQLYKTATEILDRYENFGLGRAIVAREPFTGIAKVSLENEVAEYRDKLSENKDKIGESRAAAKPTP